MIKTTIFAILIGTSVLAANGAVPTAAAHQQAQSSLTVSMEEFEQASGDDWTGTLSYLDYSSGKIAEIPASMTLELRGTRTVRYIIRFPYEGGRDDRSSWKISRDGREFGGAPIVARSSVGATPLSITTEQAGRDDNRDATIRMTYTLGADTLTARKDVRFAGESAFFNRNQFTFTR